jgi:pyridoxal phosphate enzyme (YggS family)
VSVAARLAEVHSAIARATHAAGRDPASVKLVAVSKTKPVEAVREAYAAGQRAFGENYAQELAAKTEALADLPGIEWHFIGHLQSNKAKIAAKHAHVVHTVDSTALARELGKRAAKERTSPMPVLIEVNVSGEPQKSGAAPSEIAEVVRAIQDDPALRLSGLMTVPPAGNLAIAKKTFETLALLRKLHGGAAVLPELSMGMTADLDVAIACGATIVRVGTAVFGERERAPAPAVAR